MTTLTVPKQNKRDIFSRILEEPPFVSQSLAIQDDLPVKQRVTLLLVRDLLRLGWSIGSNSHKSIELVPPASYHKEIVRAAMSYSRNEIIERNKVWIEQHLDLARSNLAVGSDVLKSEICPRIEVCETQSQHDIFRVFRYFWSSPSSDYVGRR